MTTPSGFQAPRFDEIREDTVEKFRSQFEPNAGTAPDELDGLLIDIWVTEVAVIYEALSELVAQHHYPTAEGANLDSLLALFGSPRRDDSPSTVQLVLYGDDTTVIPLASTVSTFDAGDTFVTDAAETISAGSIYAVFTFGEATAGPTTITTTIGAEISLTVAPFGGTPENMRDFVSATLATTVNVAEVFPFGVQDDGLAILVVKMTSGFSTSISSDTGSDVFDHIGELAFSTSEETGPISAVQGTVTTINAGITGWKGVVNIVDGTKGARRETDSQYRTRHEIVIGGRARATPRGLAGELFDLPGVTFVRIFENLTGVPDLLGRPSHSFETMIDGGDSELIGEIIWLNHTTGTQSTGSELQIIQDERGQVVQPREIRFSRPTKKYVHAKITITPGERFPNLKIFDIQVAVAKAIAEWGDTLGVGADVYVDEMLGQVTTTVIGTENVDVEVGVTPSALAPTPALFPTNITITDREWSRFSDTRIEVVVL